MADTGFGDDDVIDDPVPLAQTNPWQAAAWVGVAFTIVTLLPLLFAGWDKAPLYAIAAGIVTFALAGLWLTTVGKREPSA